MQFLVAEDDTALRTYIGRGLEAEGYQVRLAADGQAAIEDFTTESADMVILDLNMPRLDGLEVLQAVRAIDGEIPVLILTARSEMATRLRCLELGADDCMAKPFAPVELRAHVRALLRRCGGTARNTTLRYGSIEVNRVERTVRSGGTPVALTRKEFALLEYLLLHRGRIVSRADLLEQVWKMPSEANTNVVDVYINYLRRKLGASTGDKIVETVRGAGYAIGLCSSAAQKPVGTGANGLQ